MRDGTLDLRLDPFQNTPKGYEVLQNIEEDALLKLLRRYGSLKTNARHIATAILEARFMQYEFKTVHELTEIMESAVKHATKTPHSDIAAMLVRAVKAIPTLCAHVCISLWWPCSCSLYVHQWCPPLLEQWPATGIYVLLPPSPLKVRRL